MAAVVITTNAVSLLGTNLTDATFSTLVSGSGNGIKFLADSRSFIVLKNDSGGSLTFTLKLRSFAALALYSITPTDPTIVIAAGKSYLLKISDELQDSSGYVTIECSGAGKAALFQA